MDYSLECNKSKLSMLFLFTRYDYKWLCPSSYERFKQWLVCLSLIYNFNRLSQVVKCVHLVINHGTGKTHVCLTSGIIYIKST